MRALPMALSLALLWMGCAHSSPTPPPPPSPAAAVESAPPVADLIAAAVASPLRPEEDRARDADRRPAELMAYMGIRPGIVVADMMGGRGYYTELLSGAVGPEGTVYVQNNAYVVEKFADAALQERVARAGLANVIRLDRELEDPGLPEGGVDVVFMGLFYHDTYWMEADRPAMLAAIRASLRPDGVFVLTDHHAEAGSGARDVKTLHRVDRQLVLDEVLAAGFVLDDESDLLRHPDDDRTLNVFDEGLRGRTDRFVLRLRRADA